MEAITIIQVAQVIKERTAENDHNQALICASILWESLLGCEETNRTKILKHVREIQHLHGYMTDGMIELREAYRAEIMAGLREGLGVDYYSKIKDAF